MNVECVCFWFFFVACSRLLVWARVVEIDFSSNNDRDARLLVTGFVCACESVNEWFLRFVPLVDRLLHQQNTHSADNGG